MNAAEMLEDREAQVQLAIRELNQAALKFASGDATKKELGKAARNYAAAEALLSSAVQAYNDEQETPDAPPTVRKRNVLP